MLMSPQAVSPDWMQSKLLGIDQRFLSSVCWLLIFQLADPHVSLDAPLFQLLHEMKTCWQSESIDYAFNNLTFRCLILFPDHTSSFRFSHFLAPKWFWFFFLSCHQAVGMFCDPNDKQCRKKYAPIRLKAAETRACLLDFASIWKAKMDRTNDVHIWI